MTQPIFAEGPPVPLMVEGIVDADTLRRLFADLATSVTVLGVREKGEPVSRSGATTAGLAAVLDLLQQEGARAVQIRYRFDGSEWTDTIVAVPAGFRVVRTRHDELGFVHSG